MEWRTGLWVTATLVAANIANGCSASCEDDGLVQDDPASCAVAVDDGGSSSGGPPIPIDSEGTSSSGSVDTDGGSGSEAGSDTDPGTSSGSDTDPGTSSDASSSSTDETTGPSPTCDDGEHNGTETDVDCGGERCAPCDDGEGCADGSDCTSGVCTDGLCTPPACDDGIQNGTETDVDCGGDACAPCDDGEGCQQDADCVSGDCVDDVCVPTPQSCLEILLTMPGATDGVYEIDPDGPGGLDPFDVECDMTTDGGGWTGITPCIAQTLSGTMVAVEAASIEGIDELCRPFTRDTGPQVHTYHYTFTFPPTFTEFYLGDYQAQANCSGNGNTADIGPFVQSDWNLCHQGTHGDISFGSADAAGPVTSFAAEGTDVDTTNALVPWPAGNASYGVGGATTDFRIGWGEEGSQSEGWIPWAEGSIFLR